MKPSLVVRLILTIALLLPILAACGGSPTSTPLPTGTPPPTGTPLPTGTPPPTGTPVPTDTPAPTATPTPEPAPVPAARFEPDSCPFDLPAGMDEGTDVDCGYLLVPEDRTKPEGRTLRLAVAIFHAATSRPAADPIIYLEGGPGGSALEMLDLVFEDVYEPVLATGRDLILFDQRGVGLSEPALDCPNVTELSYELLDNEIDGEVLTVEEMADLEVEAMFECRAELSMVADLREYNTAANAADVNDLRLALGYDQVNLWAISYGTHLALEVMRAYPEGVRSAVLDSVVPPDADSFLEGPPNADRAIQVLFDDCAADAACNETYPDLEDVLWDTVDRLNGTPAEIDVTNPFTGESYDALLDGVSLAGSLVHFLYQTDVLAMLPQIIYDASNDDYFWVSVLIGALLAVQETMSDGMHYSVQCHDEAPFATREEYEAVAAQYPRLQPLFDYTNVGLVGFRICEGWDAGEAAPIADEPVSSDIPALVMAGEYDPVCPPERSQAAAERLSNSFFFTYPGVGHGASPVEGCPQDMMLAFIEDPTAEPDSDCIAAMDLPAFEVPGGAGEIEFVPYENVLMNLQGLVPAGWEQVNTGVFQRMSSGSDVTTLLAQALPVTADELAGYILEPLGLKELPEPVGERVANDITWQLYTIEYLGIPIDLALAETDAMAMMVLLQAAPAERDALYESVFLPVIDALVPME